MRGATARHVMPAESAADLLRCLQQGGVDACVGGGWAVDALLREQTREHSDVDLWVDATQLDRLITVLSDRGLDRLLPYGGDRPWNFVLHDGGTLRVDLHLYETMPDTRDLHYGSVNTGVRYTRAALDGEGLIGGRAVRCETAEWSLRWRTGYPLREVDRHDIAALCRRFGMTVPEPPALVISLPE